MALLSPGGEFFVPTLLLLTSHATSLGPTLLVHGSTFGFLPMLIS